MTTTIPTIHKHTFLDLDCEEERHIASFGPTVEAALRQCSNPGRLQYVSSAEIPYTHSTMAIALAELLPGDWEAIPQSNEYADCNWELKRADGLTLYISHPCYSHKDKWMVGLSTPRHEGRSIDAYDNNQRVTCQSIGIGVSKTVKQMASDIVRRLLSEAERVNAIFVATIERMKEAKNAQQSSMEAVCAALGIEVPRPGQSGSERLTGWFSGGTFEVFPGGNVSFSLSSVAPEKAAEIAFALRSIL